MILDPEYYNTTPLGEQGIKDHCITTSPDDCDYFLYGASILWYGKRCT